MTSSFNDKVIIDTRVIKVVNGSREKGRKYLLLTQLTPLFQSTFGQDVVRNVKHICGVHKVVIRIGVIASLDHTNSI